MATIEPRGDFREALASLAHEMWAGWMRYLFDQGTYNEGGTWTMPRWAVEQWARQMNTPYNELSEPEQDSDRREADRILAACRGDREGCAPDCEVGRLQGENERLRTALIAVYNGIDNESVLSPVAFKQVMRALGYGRGRGDDGD